MKARYSGRSVLPFLLLVVMWSLPVGCSGRPAASEDQAQTILLITVDGLVPDKIALYGGPQETPRIEALASSGHTWTDAWTAVPMTRPGAATYLTGLAPDRHGIRDDLFTSLPEGLSTLATLLAAKGYRTAAFPDSSLLGMRSGLLRDFEVVDDPPPIPVGPERWLPKIRPGDETAADFAAWLESLSPDSRCFAWVHLSQPLIGQYQGKRRKVPMRGAGAEKPEPDSDAEPTPEETAASVDELDGVVGAILDALSIQGRTDGSLIILAGTQADQTGGPTEMKGPGFSLDRAALRVPVIARFPQGVGTPRDAGALVWTPDVAATIAAVAGVDLPEGAEGESLLEEVATERIVFAWSWATRDQLGWKAQRAARSGQQVREEGLFERNVRYGEPGGEVDPDVVERLAAALAKRTTPPRITVPIENVAPLFVEHGLKPEPVEVDGRPLPPAIENLALARMLWNSRRAVGRGNMRRPQKNYEVILKMDPQNLAAMLDHGQLQALMGREESIELLGRAVELYPDDPEVLHWYAHALWTRSWEEAEPFLVAIEPYKPFEGDVLYDLACARSLAGDLEGAERYLGRALAAGFLEWDLIDIDPDLRNFRQSPRFAKLAMEYR